MLDQIREENIKNFIIRAAGVPFVDRGRDFSGWDCWGLVWMAYREALGLPLPCLANVPVLKNWQAEDLYQAIHRQHRPVVLGHEAPGDVAVFRGRPVHVGLVAQPGKMLHVEEGLCTCLEDYRGVRWRNRMIGIYRHVELA